MALPTLSKTWNIDPNNAAAITESNMIDHQKTLWAIKEALIGSGEVTAPWTVSRSSDSSTADATDRWVASTDLVWANAGVAHSWIVLKDPAASYEILINCLGTLGRIMEVVWSPSGGFNSGAGGTDGTTTARPTATDEKVLHGTNWFGTDTGSFVSKVHVGVSTDGLATWVAGFVGGVCRCFWIMCELENTPAGIPDATYIRMNSGDGTSVQVAEFAQFTTVAEQWMDDGGVTINPNPSYEAYGGTEVAFMVGQTTANDDSNEFPMGPVGVWSTTGGSAGKKGNIPDLFWGLQVNNVGDQFPSVPTLYQFAQVGDLIVPWDSSTIIQVT